MNVYRDVWNYVKEEDLMESKLFKGISQEGCRRIIQCANATVLEYKKGEYSFREGEVPVCFYLVLSGKIFSTKDYVHGRRNVFAETHKFENYGLLIEHGDRERYWYNAMAAEESKVLAIPWKYLFNFCSNSCVSHQRFLKNMVSVQAETCVYQMKKLHILSGPTLEVKIAFLFLELADQDGNIELVMKREELADFLGVSRPSLSRSLMNMKKQGLIDIRKSHAVILDVQGLKDLIVK